MTFKENDLGCSYANYEDVLDFCMRESSFTVDSLISEDYKTGVLYMDQNYLLEVNA